LAGESKPRARIKGGRGTFTLFRGRQSPHYVARVSGQRDRLMAVFSYHRKPGLTWPGSVINYVKNRA